MELANHILEVCNRVFLRAIKINGNLNKLVSVSYQVKKVFSCHNWHSSDFDAFRESYYLAKTLHFDFLRVDKLEGFFAGVFDLFVGKEEPSRAANDEASCEGNDALDSNVVAGRGFEGAVVLARVLHYYYLAALCPDHQFWISV